MKNLKIALLLSCLLLLEYSGMAQNLIQNGDFEMGSSVTNSGQISHATGWSGTNNYYGGPQHGGPQNYTSSPDLFEIGGPCNGMFSSLKSYDIPGNKWSSNLSPFNNMGSRYAGAVGSADPNVTPLAWTTGELMIGTLTQSLIANNVYTVEFNHAPGDGNVYECNPATTSVYPSSRSINTQQMWITLRYSADHTQGLIVKKVNLLPQINQWGSYSATFTLTPAEASIPWDRVEFMVRNTAGSHPQWTDAIYFLDNASLELTKACPPTSYLNASLAQYCFEPVTYNCPLYKWNDATQQFEDTGSQTATTQGVYEERCYDADGCLTKVTTRTLSILPPKNDNLTLYACGDNCKWYTPDGQEFGAYTLVGLAGPNVNQYNYSSLTGGTNPDGSPYSGWISHCLLAGGVYQFEFYNLDDQGNPNCHTRTLTVTVLDGSPLCFPDREDTICKGESIQIGTSVVDPSSLRWLDITNGTYVGGQRTVSPESSTVYLLETTSQHGCTCTTAYTVNVVDPGCYPELRDETRCLSQEYCTSFGNDCYFDVFLSQTNSITVDFGDGTQYNFNYASGNPSGFQNCHTYTNPGVYTVSYTYHLPEPCGSITTTAQVEIRPSVINYCSLTLSQADFDNLPSIINLNEIEIPEEANCCWELSYIGVWYDNQGNRINNLFTYDKFDLMQGSIIKEYVNSETCEICRLVFNLEGYLRIEPDAPIILQNNLGAQNGEIINPLHESSSNNSLQMEQFGMAAIQFSIYPNPNNGSFMISNTISLEQYKEVRIVSATGKQVFKEENLDATRLYNISKNSAGLYYITITTEDAIQTLKVILQP